MCLGGQGASVLARTFNLCGMSLGNESTYWLPEFNTDNAEHSYVTAIMAWIYTHEKEEWQSALREVLRSYKKEAEVQDWKYYGIKTTSGICNNKWTAGVSDILIEEWSDALYFGVIRPPNVRDSLANTNWNNIWTGRKGMADRGGIFVPFPDAWLNGSIQSLVKTIGLTWNGEVNSMFKHIPNDTTPYTEEELYNYFRKYPEELEQRIYLYNKSKENTVNLWRRTNEVSC